MNGRKLYTMPRMMAPGGVDDLQGGQVQKEDVVDDTVLLQQRLPGQGAQQKVHPHGKDEQQYHKAALVDLMFVQDHGQRIGQDETDHRAHQRQENGKPQCFGMLMVRMASTFSMVKLPLRSVKPYQKIMSSGMMMNPTAQTR